MADLDLRFESRRSPVLALRGMVATSQPLGAQAGLEVLQAGGNAADAAVATAAAMNVVEPNMTGIGGDCFALFFDASTKQVHAVNGSGRTPRALSIEALAERGVTGALPRFSPHTVTVPGAAAGWCDTVQRHGRLSMAEVLAPAIRLAEEGFPVTPIISRQWAAQIERLLGASPNGGELLIDGRAPAAGEIWRNERLAAVFRALADGGAEAFYEGAPGAAIVEVLQDLGALMTAEDLAAHESTFEDPISTTYRGNRVYECAPNGQGLTALIALNIVEGFDLASMDQRSASYQHLLIEAIRLAFEDARRCIADPAMQEVPVAALLSKEYAAERRAEINPHVSMVDPERGSPQRWTDTVYMTAVDGEGNACSFIDSNYNGFGTAIVPRGMGFTLQNRGAGFVLDPEHPNRVEGGKRPYHTIIPAMSTYEEGAHAGELHASFGVMGGWHQPQGHLQVFTNMIDHCMDPQAALDAPRFSIAADPPRGTVLLEEHLPVTTQSELALMGHVVSPAAGARRTGPFGKGQIIVREPSTGVLWGGSDPRGDGAAVGY
jgi:gamma-glutamyltranspeptidase/glutathione hydrolase